MSLLTGPVVFIDDQIEQEGGSQASHLLESIKSAGRPVLASPRLPTEEEREQWFEHWGSLSFLVIDWDLSPGSTGGIGGSTLGAYERAKLFVFLRTLMDEIYCPIFVISAEDTADIERQLQENETLRDANGQLDGRISVFPKDALMDNILESLDHRFGESPALSVLRTWERETEQARNRLFIDFNDLEPDWPVYIWRRASEDGTDPAYELSSVVSANLLSRVNPVAFDSAAIEDYAGTFTGDAMRKVSQGRTLIGGQRLSDRMVFPGDVFQLDADKPDEVWINVSPVCQTVPRPISKGSQELKQVRLHLVQGLRQAMPDSKNTYGKLEALGKGPTGEVIHTLLDEFPFYFRFEDAEFHLWEEIKSSRIGRLLPPYVTRLQQKHSAYMQSEGLPRVAMELYDIT